MESGVIMNSAVGLAMIIGGFIFSKRSNASDEMKKNVSMGAYLLGGGTLIFQAPRLWRVINGTHEETPLPDLSSGTTDVANVTTSSANVIELFGTYINVFHLVNLGIGVGILVVGLMFRKKNWAKYAILVGITAMVAGLVQMLF